MAKYRMHTELKRWRALIENERPRRLMLKPIRGAAFTHAIFADGVQIAEVRFERVNDRWGVRTRGRLTLNDGRSTDISGYSYFADVKRDLPDLLAQLEQ